MRAVLTQTNWRIQFQSSIIGQGYSWLLYFQIIPVQSGVIYLGEAVIALPVLLHKSTGMITRPPSVKFKTLLRLCAHMKNTRPCRNF